MVIYTVCMKRCYRYLGMKILLNLVTYTGTIFLALTEPEILNVKSCVILKFRTVILLSVKIPL